MARVILMLHFDITQRCIAVYTPVGNTGTAIDQPLFIQGHKYFPNGPGTAFIQGKTDPVPVAGNTQAFQLVDDPVAVLFFPFPDPLQEFFPAQVVTGQPFILFDFFFYFNLRCQACMVVARKPDGIVPHHPVPADQDILQCIVQGMAHVQLPCNIGGRDYNCKRFFVRIRFRMKEFVFFPELIPLFFYDSWIVSFRDVVLFCHFFLLKIKKSCCTSAAGRITAVPPAFFTV